MATTEPITRRALWVQTFLQKQLKYNFCKACFGLSSWGPSCLSQFCPPTLGKNDGKTDLLKGKQRGEVGGSPPEAPHSMLPVSASTSLLFLSASLHFAIPNPPFHSLVHTFCLYPQPTYKQTESALTGFLQRNRQSNIWATVVLPLSYPQVHLPGPSLHFKRFVSIVTKGRTEPPFQLGPTDFQSLHLKS